MRFVRAALCLGASGCSLLVGLDDLGSSDASLPDVASNDVAAGYDEVLVGYNGAFGASETFFDDVAVAAQPIGCEP